MQSAFVWATCGRRARANGYTLEDMENDTVQLLAALEIGRFHAGGCEARQ